MYYLRCVSPEEKFSDSSPLAGCFRECIDYCSIRMGKKNFPIHCLWRGASENVLTIALYAWGRENFAIHLLWLGAS